MTIRALDVSQTSGMAYRQGGKGQQKGRDWVQEPLLAGGKKECEFNRWPGAGTLPGGRIQSGQWVR